jgi:hypothetical protein
MAHEYASTLPTRPPYRQAVIYVLYLLVGTVSIELNSPYIALVFGTFIWLFGVNCTAYAIEHLTGHRHQHNRL